VIELVPETFSKLLDPRFHFAGTALNSIVFGDEGQIFVQIGRYITDANQSEIFGSWLLVSQLIFSHNRITAIQTEVFPGR
jgi:hypothetical protein